MSRIPNLTLIVVTALAMAACVEAPAADSSEEAIDYTGTGGSSSKPPPTVRRADGS